MKKHLISLLFHLDKIERNRTLLSCKFACGFLFPAKMSTADSVIKHTVYPNRGLEQQQNVCDSKIEIIHQCKDFVAVNKPYDLMINHDDDSVVSLAQLMDRDHPHLRDNSLVFGYRFTHRLDHATSGVICLSLNKKSAGLLHKRLAERHVTKHYLALVYNHLAVKKQTIDVEIGLDTEHTSDHRMCTTDKVSCTNPKSAKTTVVALEEGFYGEKPASKLLLIPHTGRTHQLRVHCDHIGHRIVGDYKYSNGEDSETYRMMLHAYRMTFRRYKNDEILYDFLTEDPFTSAYDPMWRSTKVLDTYENASTCSTQNMES